MPKDKELDEILTAVEGHGKYHTSAYDGPVMMVSEAKAAILSKYISRAEVLEGLLGEAEDFELSNGSNEGIYPNEVVKAVPTSVIQEKLSKQGDK